MPGGIIWCYKSPRSAGCPDSELCPGGCFHYQQEGIIFDYISSDGGNLETNHFESLDSRQGNKRNLGFINYNNDLVLSPDTGGIYCYSPSGRLLWSDKGSGYLEVNAGMAYGNNFIAFPSEDEGITIYNNNGKRVTNIGLSNMSIYSTPLFLDNDRIFVYGTDDGFITALDISNNTQVFSVNPFKEHIVYPLAGDSRGIITISRSSGETVLIDPSNGRVKWRITIPDLRKTDIKPVMLGSSIIVISSGSTGLEVYKIDAGTGFVTEKKEIEGQIISDYNFKTNLYIVSSGGMVPAWTWKI